MTRDIRSLYKQRRTYLAMTNTVYWIRYMHLLIDFKIVGD